MLPLTSSLRSAVTATSALSVSCSLDCKRFGGKDEVLFSSGSSAVAKTDIATSDQQQDEAGEKVGARGKKGIGKRDSGQDECIGNAA